MSKTLIRKIDENLVKYGMLPIGGASILLGTGVSPIAGGAVFFGSFIPYSIYVETDAKLTVNELNEYGFGTEDESVIFDDKCSKYRIPRNILYGFPKAF